MDARSAVQQSRTAIVTYEGLKTNRITMGAQAIVKVLGDREQDSDPKRVEKPEPGAEFEVYLRSAGSYENAREIERDRLVTDENGYAMTKPLPYVTAAEYLSGNVRDKLRIARLAAQQDSTFAINVEALEKSQPKDLEASEIDVRLGATWISADIIKQFSRELFGLPFYLDRTVKIHYSPHTAEWRIEGKSSAGVGNVSVNMTYLRAVKRRFFCFRLRR